MTVAADVLYGVDPPSGVKHDLPDTDVDRGGRSLDRDGRFRCRRGGERVPPAARPGSPVRYRCRKRIRFVGSRFREAPVSRSAWDARWSASHPERSRAGCQEKIIDMALVATV